MLRKIKLDQLVLLGFGVIVLVTTVSAVITKIGATALTNSFDLVSKSYKIKSDLDQIEQLITDAETGQRGFVYTNRENFLEPYNKATQKIENVFADLKEKIENNPEQLSKFDQLQELSQQKIAETATAIALKREGNDQELRALILSGRGKQLMDSVREKLAEMSQVEDRQLVERQRFVTQAKNLLSYLTWVSVLAVIVIGLLISFIIARIVKNSLQVAVEAAEKVSAGDLTSKIEATSNDELGKLLTAFGGMTQSLNSLIRQVQQSGIQITTSTTEIAASGRELEAAVAQQVASTNEVVATARQIAANSEELVQTMDEVTELSQGATIAASDGQQDLRKMQKTMVQLADSTSSISAKLGVISEKANNINSIVTTITKVADQTNLLSLNAAIEAEKAKEYGFGFAVVAKEIRRLADQTAVATLDIEDMVKEMQSAVSTGVMEMDKFAKEVSQGVEDVGNISLQVGQIIQQVQALNPRFETVNEGMNAQSQGAQQISEAMLQLREASTQTAEALRDTNRAIERLNDAARRLQQENARFKLSNSN
ncbi:CHASE3 domain-containing protein [Lyngbya aestuarii]|uniref:CHASE3 domain-containing protein n=1 Tax=Lyngbya aestuarii TaxID=118322 RepID=UPI00403D821B